MNVNMIKEWNKPYRKNDRNNLINLVTIKSEKTDQKIRKPKNIAFVIDNSGSMDANVSLRSMMGAPVFDRLNGNNSQILQKMVNRERALERSEKKIERVKKAVVEAISLLDENDCFSVITFESNVEVVCVSNYATEKHKLEAVSKIMKIQAKGGTSLFAGWEEGVKSLSHFAEKDFDHRVMILTDGVSTDGVLPLDFYKVAEQITKEANISTSTFGVGEGFNEDFLLGLSTHGDGNFYFLDDKADYSALFKDEIREFSNVVGKGVTLSFESYNMDNFELLNDFPINSKEEGGAFILPNLNSLRDLKLVFKCDALSKDAMFKVILSYKDENDGIVVYMDNIYVDKDGGDYRNKDVENEYLKLKLANEQTEINKLIKDRKIDEAKSKIKDAMLKADGLYDQDKFKMQAMFSNVESNLNLRDMNLASKILGYSSYSATNSKY